MLRPERLKEMLDYCPTTGRLVWKPRAGSSRSVRVFNGKFAGKPAGRPGTRGYWYVKIEQRSYCFSHVVWALATGSWPQEEIDHIDGDQANNRLSNLREATRAQNGANRGLHKNSRSGVKGVYFSKGRWVAQAGGKGNRVVRYCNSIEEARAAYAGAVVSLYGDYARLA